MYRPEKWKNLYEPIGADLNKMGNAIAYEAGADAMLEGIKKGKILTISGYKSELNGTWALIPDEQVKKDAAE